MLNTKCDFIILFLMLFCQDNCIEVYSWFFSEMFFVCPCDPHWVQLSLAVRFYTLGSDNTAIKLIYVAIKSMADICCRVTVPILN